MNKHKIFRPISIVILISTVLIPVGCKKSNNPETKTPQATTLSASGVGREWAVIKGQINGKGLFTTVTFQYDTTTDYSLSVSPSPDTTMMNYGVNFSYALTGLKPKTKYYYRITAISEGGLGVGNDISFVTTDTSKVYINFNPALGYDSIYDSEGNKYRTIVIGAQTWMAENLRSVKFNDGTDIPFVPDLSAWSVLTTPAYTWYNSDSTGYGAMYNWYAVGTGKLCPQGWHVPSNDEWTVLTDTLGGADVAGGKLKETGTDHWQSPNTGATNESGFSAIADGYRGSGGGFYNIRNYAFWWTSSEWSSTGAWYRDLFYGYESVDKGNSNKNTAANIRCIKD